MNRRQQPAPPRPPPQQQRQQRVPPQQQQQQQQQYNPNVQRQIPAQVSIPQAISILVARINYLEDKCGAETLPDNNTVEQMEEMTKRIVKLELELVTAKDIILKLQAFAINNATTAKQIVDVAGSV